MQSVALLLTTVVLLLSSGPTRGTYTVYPPMYDITDAQFATFSSCIALTFDEFAPQSKYDPICGTDGYSYYNKYALKCLGQAVPSVQFSFYGRCPNEPVFLPMESVRDWWVVPEATTRSVYTCMDGCERVFRPVCGSDDKTYSSQCVLNCVSYSMPHISQVYDGFCKQDMTAGNKCPPILQPFCGSDGITYLNLCHLRYAMHEVDGLQLSHIGDCVRRLEAIQKGFNLNSNTASHQKSGCGDGCSGGGSGCGCGK